MVRDGRLLDVLMDAFGAARGVVRPGDTLAVRVAVDARSLEVDRGAIARAVVTAVAEACHGPPAAILVEGVARGGVAAVRFHCAAGARTLG